jgi:hypothetical protein
LPHRICPCTRIWERPPPLCNNVKGIFVARIVLNSSFTGKFVNFAKLSRTIQHFEALKAARILYWKISQNRWRSLVRAQNTGLNVTWRE